MNGVKSGSIGGTEANSQTQLRNQARLTSPRFFLLCHNVTRYTRFVYGRHGISMHFAGMHKRVPIDRGYLFCPLFTFSLPCGARRRAAILGVEHIDIAHSRCRKILSQGRLHQAAAQIHQLNSQVQRAEKAHIPC